MNPLLPGPLVRLVDESGKLREHPDHPLDLAAQDLRRLFRDMTVARGVNDLAITLQRQGQLGLHLSCRGQEAAQVGSASALAARDWAFPQGRELAAAITRGVDPADLCHVWRGTWLCHHDPHERRFAPYTMPIATQLLHAVGVAMGARTAGDDIAVLAYAGDGGTSEGDAHEAMNFAAVYSAPCVFFIQNNGWSISVPLAKQTRAPTLAHRGIGYGIPAIRCDGNDVLACYAVTATALRRARSGGGPTLIEAMTYRMDGHSTSDDPTRYQPADEVAAWSRRDPLERMRRFLQRQGLWSSSLADEVDAQTHAARERLRTAIFDAPRPDPQELFAHVYSTPTPALQAQRDALTQEIRRRSAAPGS